MTLSEPQSSHRSQAKQPSLVDHLLGVLKKPDAMAVDRIHLVLAAQSGVVFNLARRYDKRSIWRPMDHASGSRISKAAPFPAGKSLIDP